MTDTERVLAWVREDPWRMAALRQARGLALPDWWLAAGFVRNLVWDRLHGYTATTTLNDIDLIYFDRADIRRERDHVLTERLRAASMLPWSVKNQARMHRRHGHQPYDSASDAMRYWVERETAVAVSLDSANRLRLSAPLGLASLLRGQVTLNPCYGDRDGFRDRVAQKGWRQNWPALEIEMP